MENKQSFGKKLKEALIKKQMSQKELADKMGVNKSTITRYIKDKSAVSNTKIVEIANILNISPSDLFSNYKEEHPIYKGVSRDELDEIDEDEVFEKVPLLGEVAAGVPIYMDDYTNDTINVDKRYIQYGYDYICLTIRGDSMYPILMDKDIVLIKCQPTANSNDIAIVSVDNETATAKYVYKHEDKLELRPANLNYIPLFFSKDEVNTRIRIIGVVTNLLDRKL